MDDILEIKDLQASIEGKHILKGFNLSVEKGQVHAIMGPNGAGKSTLAKVLAGHPFYEVNGEIFFKGQNILDMEPELRSHLGLFMSFQYPVEIPGVSTFQFLFEAYKNRASSKKGEVTKEEFEKILSEKRKDLHIEKHLTKRCLNEGFSGGEKKRFEILQMLLLNPDLAILDETDSGLDIDAMKIVAKGVNQYRNQNNSVILITHYQRLLDYIVPDVVHVMMEGKIVHSGDFHLARKLEEKGYDWVGQKASI